MDGTTPARVAIATPSLPALLAPRAVLKGKRTILFNLAMGAVGLLGWHLDPAHLQAWLDVFISALTVGNLLLRMITDTPVLTALNSASWTQGLSEIAHLEPVIAPELAPALAELAGKIDALTDHPLFDPRRAEALTQALAALAAPAPAVSALAAAAPASPASPST